MRLATVIAGLVALACSDPASGPSAMTPPALSSEGAPPGDVVSSTATDPPGPTRAGDLRRSDVERSDATGPLRPAGGALIAEGWHRPQIAVGTSGAIVSFGRGTMATPPPVSAASECEWMEDARALRWAELDGATPAEASGACDVRRGALRIALVHDVYEPTAVICREQPARLACELRSLSARRYPDIEVPAGLGRRPRVAVFEGMPYEHVSGALVLGRALVWTSVGVGAPPTTEVLTPRLPYPCEPERCRLSILPSREPGVMEVSVTLADRRRWMLAVGADGHSRGEPVLDTQDSGDPLGTGPLAIDAGRRLVRRYALSGRGLDVPVEGVGTPVMDFASAVSDSGPLVVWIEGVAPDARLRVARLNMIHTELAGSPIELATGSIDAVALDALSGHVGVAWSALESGVHRVRVAELSAFRAR